MRAGVPVTSTVKRVRHQSTYFHLHSKWGVNFSEIPQYNKANARSEGPAVECRLTGRRNMERFGVQNYIPYFPAHKRHGDFFVRNFRKKMMMNVF